MRTLLVSFLCCILSTAQVDTATMAIPKDLSGGAGGTPVTLQEDEIARKELSIVDCTPDTAGHTAVPVTCTCNMKPPTNPANGPFDVWKLTGDTNFKLYYVGKATGVTALDYSSVRTYFVTVQCQDQPLETSTTGTATIEVDILPNQAPVITGYPAVTTSTFDAQSGLAVGSTIYIVTATDLENNAISYSMTQNPSSGYLTIGASDGILKTAVDLRTVTVDTIICTVSVSDGRTTVNNFIVTVKLNNLNTRPYISNLPATINVTETQTTGFTLMTLTFNDDTPQGVNLEPQCSVDPSAESYKFYYEVGTRKLQLNNVATGQTLLDYETTNKYLITCVVYDGYLYSQGDVLTMYVNNVNEAPVFSQSIYYCTMAESNAGVNTCVLGVSVSDPELNTITRVELLPGNNSERFQYNRATDRLTFNVDYDVDGGAMPTSVILTMDAVDSNLATGTAKISINIQDANDNTCNFGTAAAAEFNINQGTTTGTLGSFAATDADLTSPNNLVTFEVISGVPTSALNYLTVFGNGEIKYVGLIPETEHGKSYALTIRCRDKGSPSLSATGTVQVSYLTTTTSTTTTTTTTTTTPTPTTTTTVAPSTSVWDQTAFVAVFALLMAILGLALLAAVYYFCCRNGIQCQDLAPRYERHPSPRHVRPRDEFMRGSGQDRRVSPDYRDQAWRQGDHYEDGIGYEGRPATKSDIFITNTTGHTRALPAPRGYY